jgi:hypothetical protein
MAQPPKEDLVLQFLSGLPSHDPKNFQKFANKEPKESVTKKPKTYVSTKDTEPSQLIVTDKTNILLRYLRQKSERENNEGKDKGSPRPKNPPPKSSDEFVSPWKRPRRD